MAKNPLFFNKLRTFKKFKDKFLEHLEIHKHPGNMQWKMLKHPEIHGKTMEHAQQIQKSKNLTLFGIL